MLPTRRLSITSLPLLIACGDPNDTTGDATSHDGKAGKDGTGTPVLELGDCREPAGAVPSGVRVVYEGRFGCYMPSGEEVVTAAARWTAVAESLASCGGSEPDPVDLDVEYVVVLGHGAGNTCGYELDRIVVRSDEGGPFVSVDMTDRSRGCETACTMVGGLVVALAIPKRLGESPTLCRRIHPGCP